MLKRNYCSSLPGHDRNESFWRRPSLGSSKICCQIPPSYRIAAALLSMTPTLSNSSFHEHDCVLLVTSCFPSKDSAISQAYGSLQLAKHPANADKTHCLSCRTHGRLAHPNSSVVEQIATSMQKSGELHLSTICARSNMARVASSLPPKR